MNPMLKKSLRRKVDWDLQVKFGLFAIRATPNRSTGFSPFQLVYGRNLRSPLDVVLQQFHAEENTPVDGWRNCRKG